jgi:hypothetical protein
MRWRRRTTARHADTDVDADGDREWRDCDGDPAGYAADAVAGRERDLGSRAHDRGAGDADGHADGICDRAASGDHVLRHRSCR